MVYQPPGISLLYPPNNSEIVFPQDDDAPLVSLWGSHLGIATKTTWHSIATQELYKLGYKGFAYIPHRIHADLQDYDPALNYLEQSNNYAAFKRSSCVLYWQDDSTDVDLLGYSLVLLTASAQFVMPTVNQRPQIHVGGCSPKLLSTLARVAPYVAVHGSVTEMCKAGMAGMQVKK